MMQSFIDACLAFWRARTARERLILKGGAVLIGILLPLLAYQGAATYRTKAAAALSSARSVQADVRRLAAPGAAGIARDAVGDGSLRGIAFALAQANGLTVASIETAGPERVRVTLEPADSLKVYRWIDAVSRRGAALEKTELQRVGQTPGGGDQVTAEFEIALATAAQ
jgi:type II secretory pathway component PulM